MSAQTCQVFEIVRGTAHDGPGVRTTVFIKGCPLHCLWCHNPEGISEVPEIGWDAGRCIRCLDCMAACPADALCESEQGLVRDRDVCRLCGACVEACPSRAMEFTAREWDMDRLVREVLKDRDYYSAFGGGVTVSGGEPLSRYEFVSAFFQRLRAYDIHTALDTCGMASKEALEAVLEHTDHVLFDLKVMDAALHRRYTKQSNNVILRSLLFVGEIVRKCQPKEKRQSARKKALWIRTPLIPGATATPENLSAIGAFVREHLADVTERWELCAFNNACFRKYQKLGLTWTFEGTPLMSSKDVDELRYAALSTGFAREKLVVSGLIAKARKEPQQASP
jgi:pyruvate formate lyase activating enzyme